MCTVRPTHTILRIDFDIRALCYVYVIYEVQPFNDFFFWKIPVSYESRQNAGFDIVARGGTHANHCA